MGTSMKNFGHGSSRNIARLAELLKESELMAAKRALDFLDLVKEVWNPIDEVSDPPPKIYAIDGSLLRFESQSLTLFGVYALAVPLGKGLTPRWKELHGIVTPPVKTDDRVILYMEALETELAKEVSGSALVLADGALSMIAKCRTHEGKRCNCACACNNILDVIGLEDAEAQCKLCLECLMKEKAVSEILRNGENIFYIAKKYHSYEIFEDDVLDDLTIFHLATIALGLQGPGASIVFEREIRLERLGRREKVRFFYARFAPHGNVYYVETPNNITTEDAKEFVKSMSRLSMKGSGYLLPLVHAHKMVEQKQSQAFKLLKKKLRLLRTGREGL